MSGGVDLMPAACRARLRSRNASRRVALLLGGTGAAALSLSLTVHLVAAARRVELARLQRETKIHADIAQRLETVRKASEEELASLRRYARAAAPVSFSDVMSVIGGLMPEPVSLTTLSISPRLDRAARGAARVVGALNVEFAGVAPTDLEIATLVAGMESSELFSRVTIEHARAQTLGDREGRVFGVTAEIDLNARRLVADAFADFEKEGAKK
ncbi:MAG: PilN domain-containing protein [Phycisphaerales bacterium]|nr:PilN domain-containing protein [Phycisphaerales bacterium]